jgi:cellobiose phosphorylase
VTGEPFVLNNGYYGPAAAHRAGHSDSGWITGTAGWFVRVLIDRLFGLRPDFDGLHVAPWPPLAWCTAAIRRAFRGATYRVNIARSAGGAVTGIKVDGCVHAAGPLPWRAGGVYDVTVTV